MEPGEYVKCLHTGSDVDGVSDYVNDGAGMAIGLRADYVVTPAGAPGRLLLLKIPASHPTNRVEGRARRGAGRDERGVDSAQPGRGSGGAERRRGRHGAGRSQAPLRAVDKVLDRGSLRC